MVNRETVGYRSSDTSFNFDPKNSAGINLIRQVYDSVLAQDFASSTLIYQGKDKTLRPSFYQGSRYGYITEHFLERRRQDRTPQRTVSQLTVVPLSQLENEIQRDKTHCAYNSIVTSGCKL